LRLDSDLGTLVAEVRKQLGALIDAADRSAITTRRAVGSPLPHRLEPYLHERAWINRGAFVDGRGEERYGFDAEGQVVVVRIDAEALYRDSRWGRGRFYAGEFVLRGPGVVVTVVYDAEFPGGHTPQLDHLIRHTLEDGRVVRTEYSRGGEERYHYEGAELVAIDEFDDLLMTTRLYGWRGNWNWNWEGIGGRIDVRDGELRRGAHLLNRPERPFSELFAERLPAYADAVIEHIVAWAERDPARPVDMLWLDNYTQHSPVVTPYVGYADRRERWPFWDDGPGPQIDLDDDEGTLMRTGALAVDDPIEAICDAVAHRLLTHDWSGVLTTTDDLVVAVFPNDGFSGLEASVRKLNPPEAAARWLRKWDG
jgi:hypothetical protein